MKTFRYKNLTAAFGLVVFSFFTLTDSFAQVIYTDIVPDTVVTDGSYSFDFDNDGINEFQINQALIEACNKIRVIGHTDTSIDHLVATAMVDADYTMRFPQNAVIDPSDPFQNSNSYIQLEDTSEWAGYFEGYVGVLISLDGQTHYGWVRIGVAADGSTVTIKDYAYEATPNTAIQAGMGSLPVELAEFNAQVDHEDILLRWSTLSELDNAGFEVQQKINDSFEPVAFVPGMGTTNQGQDYMYRIAKAGVGDMQFRLRQVDINGSFSYSSLVNVSVDLPASHVVSDAYPNPFNPQSTFSLTVNETQDVTVGIYNAVGQKVADVYTGMLEANQTRTFTIDGSQLSSGIYMYRVTGENFDQTRSITLLK